MHDLLCDSQSVYASACTVHAYLYVYVSGVEVTDMFTQTVASLPIKICHDAMMKTKCNRSSSYHLSILKSKLYAKILNIYFTIKYNEIT